MITITFTGHRPNKLKGGYDYSSKHNLKLKMVIFEEIIKIIKSSGEKEHVHFITGGALGVDQMAFEVANYMRREYSNTGCKFTIELAMPFENMDSKWIEKSKEYFKEQRKLADKVTIVCEGDYTPLSMQIRNEYMVDNADYIICIWNGTTGGTGNCVKYAQRQNINKIYINPNDIH